MNSLGKAEKGLFVVLLPTLECNLSCQYCFEAHPKGRWGIQETQEILGKIFSYALEDQITHLVLHWHGGEALLMGVEYWAEVLSADAFSAFEEAGVDDPDAVARGGRLFRDTVLGLGGSQPAMDVFVAFRGRTPDTSALLRHSGLAGATC